MKRPSPASLKRVTAENLARLGTERLAEILVEVAETRAELKRRLRMELAAEQGPEHLLPEIDRRMNLIGASRGAVSWRQRPAFVRDLDGVRGLIAGRLAELDPSAAQDRIVIFLSLSPQAQRRVRDKEGAVDRVFAQAAADAIELLAMAGPREGGARLAETIAAQPFDWSRWSREGTLPAHPDLARATLGFLGPRSDAAFLPVVRRLADAAGDPDAFRSTFTDEEMAMPSRAAEVARRFLRAGRLEAAREVLEGAVKPSLMRRGRSGKAEADFDWESAWIDYLESAGRAEEAQAARWASFERNLSLERAKAYVKRLPDFEDVEAEQRIFDLAAGHGDAEGALTLLMDWPALGEASRFVLARGETLRLSPEQAELWARRLRTRYPEAAQRLLRRAAAEAFRRREYKTSTQLSEQADAISS